MMQGPKKRVCLTLPLELYTQLKELSEENVYPLPGYIRHILTVHVRTLAKAKDKTTAAGIDPAAVVLPFGLRINQNSGSTYP